MTKQPHHEDDWAEVEYGILEAASEDATGLGEIRRQWDRELTKEVIADLVERGLIVVGTDKYLRSPGPIDELQSISGRELRELLSNGDVWEPGLEEWNSGEYISFLGTKKGDEYYDKLASERFDT